MDSGWIKLYRKITENPLYFSEPFTRMQAWIDMLILAAHNDNFFYVRGNRVNISKGEIGYSQENLAKRWKWSRGRVSRFIKQLETDGMIVQQKSKIITTISIANYHTYQHGGTTDDTTNSTTDGRQTVQQTDINKNVKNEKNVKEEYGLSDEFAVIVKDWFDYKKERRESYKSEKSKSAFVLKLKKLSGDNPIMARKIIEQSMANNWAGVFELKITDKQQQYETKRYQKLR